MELIGKANLCKTVYQPERIPEKGIRWNVWPTLVGGGHTAKDRWATEHPAMMPEKLARGLILTYSDPGDAVLDPFAGAGTTPKMAELHNRQYIGVEINRRYFQRAQRRVNEAEHEVRRRLDEWPDEAG